MVNLLHLYIGRVKVNQYKILSTKYIHIKYIIYSINKNSTENHLDCSKYLLRAGANINSTNISGETPLHLVSTFSFAPLPFPPLPFLPSSLSCSLSAFAVLIFLLQACLLGGSECIKLLIEKGVNINAQDESG